MKSSKSKWLWSGLVFLALAAVAISGYFYFFISQSLSLAVSGPTTPQAIGIPFEINAQFANNSQNNLKNVRLVLTLPQNSMAADGGGEKVLEKDLNDVAVGGSAQTTFSVIALPTGSASSTPLDFKVTAFYSLSSVTANFQKEADVSVPVADSGFTLNLTLPQSVYAGEEFNLEADYGRSGQSQISNLKLKLDYPNGFREISFSPSRTGSALVWDLGDLASGGSGKINVSGEVNLPDGSVFPVTVELLGRLGSNDYSIVSQTASSTVAVSPLSLSVSLAQGTSTAVEPGSVLNYVLSYRNNTNVDFHDVTLKAALEGGMFNLSSLKTTGKLSGGTLIWDGSVDSSLSLVAAGASGTETVSVALSPAYPTPAFSNKNLTAAVNASIKSPTVPYLINAAYTESFASLSLKVADIPAVSARGYFRDAQTGALNTGPWPPKVGSATEYTVHWQLTNFSDDLSGATVKAALPPGVTFTQSISSNATSTPAYDPSSNSIIWNVGNLPAWSGSLASSPAAVFQISATPQANNIGSPMEILGETDLSAEDGFTNASVEAVSPSITTALPDDPTINPGEGNVVGN